MEVGNMNIEKISEKEKKQRDKAIENKKLIAKAKAGDMIAFETLILEHEKIVYNVAFRMMNNSEDAKDLSQDALIKAFKSIGNFNEQSSFSTWIYRITVNTCIDEIRKRKGKQNFSLDSDLEGEEGSWKQQFADTDDTPEESVLRKEDKSEIAQALDTLSPEHKIVIVLREMQGLSYEEIAESTGMTLGTVKSRISRARNQLKIEILKIWERNE